MGERIIVPVPVYDNVNSGQFLNEVHPLRKPAILRGLEIGPCREKWTADYLSCCVGDKPVKIHVSETGQMDFLTKNFQYKTLPFNQLIERCAETVHVKDNFFLSETEVYYLRSLGTDKRGREVANLENHYPELSQDFKMPAFLEPSTVFSTVLRVASKGVQLWTHYDVMDNLLVQVTGTKRAVLYSPEDLPYLYLEGDKSKVIDIDDVNLDLFPEFVKATSYECIMEPGDVLFIPALWFHNMTSLDFSVAINVFWRNLIPDVYDKKDPYGNKDPIPASKVIDNSTNSGNGTIFICTFLLFELGTGNDRICVETSFCLTRGISTILQEKNSFSDTKKSLNQILVE